MKSVFTKIVTFIIIVLSFITISPLKVGAQTYDRVNIYVFHNADCTHCQSELKYLDNLKAIYEDKINVYEYEMYYDSNNESKFKYIKENLISIVGNSVPYTIIGNTTFSGFSESTKREINNAINYYMNNSYIDKVGKYLGVIDVNFADADNVDNIYNPNYDTIDLPIFGTVNIKSISIPIISILLGLIDGFNPCAMWVLLFLITMLLNMKNRKKMWILGVVFLATSALIYLLIMILWLNIFVSIALINWVRILIGLVAIVGGGYNVYNFIKHRKDDGCHIVKKEKRNKIFTKIKELTNENTNFILAIMGIITLAVSVNFVELACSAGLPLIFTQILAMNNVVLGEQIIYFSLYILFFLLDDLIVFFIAMTTLKVCGISGKYGKISQIVGGVILILIGMLMIFYPSLLTFSL